MFHRGADIGVAHEFLLHVDRSSSLVQKTPESVAEGVPADVTYAAAYGYGRDMPLSHSPGLPRRRACLEGTREYPVLGLVELRRALPLQQHFGKCRIERHACPRVFGFYIANNRIADSSFFKFSPYFRDVDN
jgi:hypothetical protein